MRLIYLYLEATDIGLIGFQFSNQVDPSVGPLESFLGTVREKEAFDMTLSEKIKSHYFEWVV